MFQFLDVIINGQLRSHFTTIAALDVMVTQLFIDDAGFHRITQLNSNNVEYALPDVGSRIATATSIR
ncbi:Uncharacterised protein [Pantoea agglomerans]|uniref:Uncharacterized protein n=1 Tax=Enterobacter agglomerans TaxID=549 RepID=A0A379ACI4_ENTAG|nr:Uncharacterised protein [Pantoea agglomerans]